MLVSYICLPASHLVVHGCPWGEPEQVGDSLITSCLPSCRLPGHEGVQEGLLSHQTQQQALQARAGREEHPSEADGRGTAGAEAADRHQAHQVGERSPRLHGFPCKNSVSILRPVLSVSEELPAEKVRGKYSISSAGLLLWSPLFHSSKS